MAVPADASLIDWLAGVQRGQEGLLQVLNNIHDDLHALGAVKTLRPEYFTEPVSSRAVFTVDKRGRDHLYIASPVALELFYGALPSQVGSALQFSITVPAGRFVELPFATGDTFFCPGISVANEVTVYLVAQNAVLLQ